MKLNRIFLTLILVILFSNGVGLASKDMQITIDGMPLHTDVAPKLVNNRTLVPVRAIFEAVGAELDWDPHQNMVVATKDHINIKLIINASHAYVNDELITLDSPAIIVNNRTMVPLRFIAESLGGNVDWDSISRTVIITSEPSNPSYLSLNGVTIKMGDTLDQVEKLLGKADRIDPSFYDYKWYVYNKDYNNFLMVGIGDRVVKAIYTNSRGFEVNGIKYGDIGPHIESRFRLPGQLVTLYFDKHEENRVHGCLISITGVKKEIKNDYELMKAQELQNFDSTNAFRVNHGKKPLKFNSLLYATAKAHSQDMADNNYFSHTNLDGLSSWQRYTNRGGGTYSSFAENISAERMSGLDALDGWINSIGHRENILEDHEFLGVGLAYNELSKYKYYMTQNFSSPRNW